MQSTRFVAAIGESIATDLTRGWYIIKINGLSPEMGELRLRLDIGRGFSEHHSIGVWRDGAVVSAVSRLFKRVRAIQPMGKQAVSGRIPIEITFSRIPVLTLSWYRLIEIIALIIFQFHNWRNRASVCDRPYIRYLRWRDMFSFPHRLSVHSRYSEWILRNEILAQHSKKGSCAPAIGPIIVLDDPDPGKIAVHWSDKRTTIEDYSRFGALPKQFPDAWIVGVRPGYQLHSIAVETLRNYLNTSEDCDILYGDHDRLDFAGRRFNPHFQFGFSLDRLRSEDWLGPVIAISVTALREIEEWSSLEFDSARHLIALRVAERSGGTRARHIPRILAHAMPAIPQNRTNDTGLQTIPEPRLREQTSAAAISPPLVSIIMPTKDRFDLVSRAVHSILQLSNWSKFEIIIIDHDSKEEQTCNWLREISRHSNVHVFLYSGPFNFSDMNNKAAETAKGEILAFLNNDIEVISSDWIDHLVAVTLQNDIGCAGAMLLYPDGTVQHDGISLGIGGIGAHAQRDVAPAATDTNLVLAVRRNVAAVTGACLFVKSELFRRLGGFDAENLPVAFNDIDLCLRAMTSGLRNIWLPEAKLIHHESATRQSDSMNVADQRFMREFAYMRNRWGTILDNDPYYSVNFDLRRSGLAIRL